MTGQPTNPLIGRQSQKPGKVTKEMLDDLATGMNRSNFVRDSGHPYFVNRRFDGETHVHFLDRR